MRATRFLEENQIDGHGFNGLRDGGYLAWAAARGADLRQTRASTLIRTSSGATSKRREKSPALFDADISAKRGATWALTERERERLGGYRLLDANPGWALVYWDDTSSLYLRRDQPQLASLIESFEYKRVHPWGNLLRSRCAAFDRSQLNQTDSELLRFLKTTPGDVWALSMACASKKREGDPGAESLCAIAEQAAINSGSELLMKLAERRAQLIVGMANYLVMHAQLVARFRNYSFCASFCAEQIAERAEALASRLLHLALVLVVLGAIERRFRRGLREAIAPALVDDVEDLRLERLSRAGLSLLVVRAARGTELRAFGIRPRLAPFAQVDEDALKTSQRFDRRIDHIAGTRARSLRFLHRPPDAPCARRRRDAQLCRWREPDPLARPPRR